MNSRKKMIEECLVSIIIIIAITVGFAIINRTYFEYTPPKQTMVKHFRKMKSYNLHSYTHSITFGVYSDNGQGTTDENEQHRYHMPATEVLDYKQNHYLNKIKNIKDYKYSIHNHSERTQLIGDHHYDTRTIDLQRK